MTTSFLRVPIQHRRGCGYLLACALGVQTMALAHSHSHDHVETAPKPSTKSKLATPSKPVPKTKPTSKLPVSKTTIVKVPPLFAVSSSLIRLGEAAPAFSFPDAQERQFTPIQELGQRSIYLVVVGKNIDEAKPKNGDFARLAQEFSDVASQRREDTLRIVLAVSNPKQWSRLKSPRVLPNLTPVFDADRALQKTYGVKDHEIALIAIDRAGFVREQTLVPDVATLKARLLPLRELHQEIVVGSIAPDFDMRDAQGQLRRLSDLRGRQNLLLTFFPKCFTGNCSNHLNSLRESHADLQNAQTEVWAVSVDSADGERGQIAFQEKLGLKFPLIPDTERHLCLLYGAVYSQAQLATRMSVLIDKNGVVRWIDKQINLKTHGADVLDKVRTLSLNQ